MPRTRGIKTSIVSNGRPSGGGRIQIDRKLNAIDVCGHAKDDAGPRSVQEEDVEAGGVSGKPRGEGDMMHGAQERT